MGVAYDNTLRVELLWSGEVIFLRVDEIAGLQLADRHLNCEGLVGWHRPKVRGGAELRGRHRGGGGDLACCIRLVTALALKTDYVEEGTLPMGAGLHDPVLICRPLVIGWPVMRQKLIQLFVVVFDATWPASWTAWPFCAKPEHI